MARWRHSKGVRVGAAIYDVGIDVHGRFAGRALADTRTLLGVLAEAGAVYAGPPR